MSEEKENGLKECVTDAATLGRKKFMTRVDVNNAAQLKVVTLIVILIASSNKIREYCISLWCSVAESSQFNFFFCTSSDAQKAIINELNIRRKALQDESFPSQDVIDEFSGVETMPVPEKVPLEWTQPNLIQFMVCFCFFFFSSSYCFSKVIINV